MGQRLGYPELSGLDLLELWAFVHPARFVVPTPKGFARALNLFIGNGELAESDIPRSEEHTSELQSLMRISYAVFCLKNKIKQHKAQNNNKYDTIQNKTH